MFGLKQFLKRCARIFSSSKGELKCVAHFTDIFTSKEFESLRLEYMDALLEQAFLFFSRHSKREIDGAMLDRVLGQPHLFSELVSDLIPIAQSMLLLDRSSAVLVSYEFLRSLSSGAPVISETFLKFLTLRAAFNPNFARNSIVAGMGMLMNAMEILPVGGVLVLASPFFYNLTQQRRFHAKKLEQIDELLKSVLKIETLDEEIINAVRCIASVTESVGERKKCDALQLLLHWPVVKDHPWLRYAIEFLLNQHENALDMDRVFSSLEKKQPNFLSCFDLKFTREVGKCYVLKSGRLMSVRNAHLESYEDFDESQIESLQKLIENGVFSSSLSWFCQYVFMWALMNRLEEMMASFQQRSDKEKIEAVRALLASMRACPFFNFDLQPPFNRNETSIDRESIFIYRRLEQLTLRAKNLEARCRGAMELDHHAGDYVDHSFAYVYRGGNLVENPAEIAAILCRQAGTLDEADSKLDLERFALSAEALSGLEGDVFQALLGSFPASILVSQALLLRLERDIRDTLFISSELVKRYKPMILALDQSAHHALFQYCLNPEKLEKQQVASLTKANVLLAFGAGLYLGLDGRVWKAGQLDESVSVSIEIQSVSDLLSLLTLLELKPHHLMLRKHCIEALCSKCGFDLLTIKAYEHLLRLAEKVGDDAFRKVKDHLHGYLVRSRNPEDIKRMLVIFQDSVREGLIRRWIALYQEMGRHEEALQCATEYQCELGDLGYESCGEFYYHSKSGVLFKRFGRSFQCVNNVQSLGLSSECLAQSLSDPLLNQWALRLEALPGKLPEELYEPLVSCLEAPCHTHHDLLDRLLAAGRRELLSYCAGRYFMSLSDPRYQLAFNYLFDESTPVTERLGKRLANNLLILPSGAVYRFNERAISALDFSRPGILIEFLSIYATAVRYGSQPLRVLELMDQAISSERLSHLKARHWFDLLSMKSECVNKVLAKAVRSFFQACFQDPDFSGIELSLLPEAFKFEGVLDDILLERLKRGEFSLLFRLGAFGSLCSDEFFKQVSIRFVSDISTEEVAVLRDVLMQWLFQGETLASLMTKLKMLDTKPKEVLAGNVITEFQERGDHVSALHIISEYGFAFEGFGYARSGRFAYETSNGGLFSMPEYNPVDFSSEFFDKLSLEDWHALFRVCSAKWNPQLNFPKRYFDLLVKEAGYAAVSLELLPEGFKEAQLVGSYLKDLCLSDRFEAFKGMYKVFSGCLSEGFSSQLFATGKALKANRELLSALCEAGCLKRVLDRANYFVSPEGSLVYFDGSVVSDVNVDKLEDPLLLLALSRCRALSWQLPSINKRLGFLFRAYLYRYFNGDTHGRIACLEWISRLGASKACVKGGLLRRWLAHTIDFSCDIDIELHFSEYSFEISLALKKAGFEASKFVPGLWRNQKLKIDLMISFGSSVCPSKIFTVNEVVMPLSNFLMFAKFDPRPDLPITFEAINEAVLSDLSGKTLSSIDQSVELDVSGKLILFFLTLRYHLEEGFGFSPELLLMLKAWLDSITELTPDQRDTLNVKFGELTVAARGVEVLRPLLDGLGFSPFFRRHGYFLPEAPAPLIDTQPGNADVDQAGRGHNA